ncbi:MAG: hypothetical protein Q4D03_00440 [Bacteroidales bacterium]|nr:hypothetical protein [Bacteroidales bacterium]
MKRLSYISIAFSLLVMIALSGGVYLEQCACTGQITLLEIDDEGCCNGESSCMTTYVISLPNGISTSHINTATVWLPSIGLLWGISLPTIRLVPALAAMRTLCYHAPPGRLSHCLIALRI